MKTLVLIACLFTGYVALTGCAAGYLVRCINSPNCN